MLGGSRAISKLIYIKAASSLFHPCTSAYNKYTEGGQVTDHEGVTMMGMQGSISLQDTQVKIRNEMERGV